MAQQVITPAGLDNILSASDLGGHLREDAVAEQSDTIEGYIAAAHRKAELYTRRLFLTQTVRLTFDGFGSRFSDAMPIALAPVQSIDQIQYMDDSGTWVTLDADRYRLVHAPDQAEVRPTYGSTWPVPRLDAETVRIDVVVGYGAAASDVPANIIQAIKYLAAQMYENREGMMVGAGVQTMPQGFTDMLDSERVWF